MNLKELRFLLQEGKLSKLTRDDWEKIAKVQKTNPYFTAKELIKHSGVDTTDTTIYWGVRKGALDKPRLKKQQQLLREPGTNYKGVRKRVLKHTLDPYKTYYVPKPRNWPPKNKK